MSIIREGFPSIVIFTNAFVICLDTSVTYTNASFSFVTKNKTVNRLGFSIREVIYEHSLRGLMSKCNFKLRSKDCQRLRVMESSR